MDINPTLRDYFFLTVLFNPIHFLTYRINSILQEVKRRYSEQVIFHYGQRIQGTFLSALYKCSGHFALRPYHWNIFMYRLGKYSTAAGMLSSGPYHVLKLRDVIKISLVLKIKPVKVRMVLLVGFHGLIERYIVVYERAEVIRNFERNVALAQYIFYSRGHSFLSIRPNICNVILSVFFLKMLKELRLTLGGDICIYVEATAAT